MQYWLYAKPALPAAPVEQKLGMDEQGASILQPFGPAVHAEASW